MEEKIKIKIVKNPNRSKKYESFGTILKSNNTIVEAKEEEIFKEPSFQTYRTCELSSYPQVVSMEVEFNNESTDFELLILFERFFVSSIVEIILHNRNKKDFQQTLIKPKNSKDIAHKVNFKLKFRKYFLKLIFEKPFSIAEEENSFLNIYEQIGIDSICFSTTYVLTKLEKQKTLEEDLEILNSLMKEKRKVTREDVEIEIESKYGNKLVDKKIILRIYPIVKKKLFLIKEEKFKEVHEIQQLLNKMIDIGKRIHSLKVSKKMSLVQEKYKEVHSITKELQLNEKLFDALINGKDTSELISLKRKRNKKEIDVKNQELKIQKLTNQLAVGLEKEGEYYPHLREEQKQFSKKFFNGIFNFGFGEEKT